MHPLAKLIVDEDSSVLAENAMASIKTSFERIHASKYSEIYKAVSHGKFPTECVAEISRPIKELKIDANDLVIDVEDFAVVTVISRMFENAINGVVPVKGRKPIPIMPQSRAVRRSNCYPWWQAESELFGLSFFGAVQKLSVKEAANSFMDGLTSQLKIRISAWKAIRRNSPNRQEITQLLGGPPPVDDVNSGLSGSSGQWWEVNTDNDGLSICYTGTHSARTPLHYLPGETTPVKVYLPLGTVYLGANSGLGNSVVWDPRIVSVPSMIPIFTTNRF